MTVQIITAVAPTNCGACTTVIMPGEKVLWDGRGGAYHPDCAPPALKAQVPSIPAEVEVSQLDQ